MTTISLSQSAGRIANTMTLGGEVVPMPELPPINPKAMDYGESLNAGDAEY